MLSLRRQMEIWDAKWNFPKPASEEHIDGYHAFLKLAGVAGWGGFYVALSLGSLVLAAFTYNLLRQTDLSFDTTLGVAVYAVFFVLFSFILIGFSSDLTTLTMPYWSLNQRLSHGNARWAKEVDLRDRNILFPTDKPLPDGYVRLMPFRNKQIALHHKEVAMGGAVMSPAGSGKSSLFFMHLIRSFSRVGGVIALDIKGELYRHTMQYFGRVFRIDIRDPRKSDHLDLFGKCYRNPTEAYSLAAYILGFNPNKDSHGNPIWDRSAVSMLGLMLLHISQLRRNPIPKDILHFLSTHPPFEKVVDIASGEEKFTNPLHDAMTSSPDEFVRMMWENQFRRLPAETYNSVKFNLDGYMTDFFNPKLTAILTPPTEREIRQGRKTITFEELRKLNQTPKGKLGTAIYVIISVKDTKIMSSFLRTLFSSGIDHLRASKDTETPVLFAMDEAGNVPLYSVPEGINTDRSIGLCYWLGYQDMTQPSSQFGDKVAETFMSALNTYIFLPGIKGKTAKFASELLGKTTILHQSSSDSKNDNFDSTKVSEVAAQLMYEDALRQMPRFRKAIVVTGDCPPIYTAPNEDAKVVDRREFELDGFLLETTSISSDLLRSLNELEEKWTVEDQIELDRLNKLRNALAALNTPMAFHQSPVITQTVAPAQTAPPVQSAPNTPPRDEQTQNAQSSPPDESTRNEQSDVQSTDNKNQQESENQSNDNEDDEDPPDVSGDENANDENANDEKDLPDEEKTNMFGGIQAGIPEDKIDDSNDIEVD